MVSNLSNILAEIKEVVAPKGRTVKKSIGTDSETAQTPSKAKASTKKEKEVSNFNRASLKSKMSDHNLHSRVSFSIRWKG
jgi:hypothetical protein